MADLVEMLLKIVQPIVRPFIRGPEGPEAPWILATGFWNDAGKWDDNETWND